jgi:hypothetical protein
MSSSIVLDRLSEVFVQPTRHAARKKVRGQYDFYWTVSVRFDLRAFHDTPDEGGVTSLALIVGRNLKRAKLRRSLLQNFASPWLPLLICLIRLAQRSDTDVESAMLSPFGVDFRIRSLREPVMLLRGLAVLQQQRPGLGIRVCPTVMVQ